VDPENDRLLGAGVVGSGAGELIAEAVLAIEMAANVRDIALSIHPHPTLSETWMESAQAANGHAIHIHRSRKDTT
jgi:dihydrolipoamide dehydrogenase